MPVKGEFPYAYYIVQPVPFHGAGGFKYPQSYRKIKNINAKSPSLLGKAT